MDRVAVDWSMRVEALLVVFDHYSNKHDFLPKYTEYQPVHIVGHIMGGMDG